MGGYILHKDGAYNIFSTVADAPLYDHALTMDEVRSIVEFESGQIGLEQLGERLERAHRRGCSSLIPMSLEECIMGNRAGPKETEMPKDEFVHQFLTFSVGTNLSEAAPQAGQVSDKIPTNSPPARASAG